MNCLKSKDIQVSELIIKKSKFITSLKFVNSEQEAKDFILDVKNKYKDATHNCSAYIVGLSVRRDDDGEPSQTAGQPMLDVLQYKELNYVCAVVTRYFGGIKLGAGGLVRAYSKSLSQALDTCELISLVPGYEVSISFDYSNIKVIDHFLSSKEIVVANKRFEKDVMYIFAISKNIYEDIKEHLKAIDYNINIVILNQIDVCLDIYE